MPGTTTFNNWTKPSPGDSLAEGAARISLGLDAADQSMRDLAVSTRGYSALFPDDTTALQAAAAAARASVGSTLHLLPGKTFELNAAVDMTGLIVRFNGATLKAAAGITAPNLISTTGSLTVIGPGVIDGNKANNTNPGVNSAGNGIYAGLVAPGSKISIGSGITIKDCWQRGITVASTATLTDAANASDLPVTIDGVSATGCGTYGIFVTKTASPVIRNFTATGNANGVFVQLCKSPSVSAGVASSNTVQGVSIMYCLDPTVMGVTANGNGGSGITFGGGIAANTPNKRGSISGCTANNNTQNGITVDPTISGSSGVPVEWGGAINGNTCKDNDLHGIVTTAVAIASISGNTCQGNRNGVSLNSSNRVTVGGNTLTNNDNYGVAWNASSAPSSGFYGRHTIGGNNLDGNTLGRIGTASYHDPNMSSSIGTRETTGTAAPTTGTWERGDRCWNTAPVAAFTSVIGWVCTASGTPGTWRVMAPAEASGQVTDTPPADGVVAIPVTFPSGRFSTDLGIRVLVSINASTSPKGPKCSVDNVTSTGCTIYLYRDTATATSVAWLAVQGVES